MKYKMNILLNEKSRVRSVNWTAVSCGFLILTILSINLSSTATSVSFLLAALCALIAAGPRKTMYCWLQHKFVIPLILLALILFIGVFYNHYSSSRAWHQFTKYVGKMVFFLLLLPAFTERRYRVYFYNGAVISIFFVSIMIYVGYKFIPALYTNNYMYGHMVHAIPWSYILAFCSFLLVNQIIDFTKYRLVRGVILLWFLYALFFLNIERRGMLAGMLLAFVVCGQRMPWRKALWAGLAIILVACSLYFISTAVHTRVLAAVHNVIVFVRSGSPHGSINERLYMAKHSWGLILRRPWFGYGTGTFPSVSHSIGAIIVTGSSIAGRPKNILYLGDPHNTFLHLWIQVGLVGLLCFVAFLYLQFIESFRLPKFEKFMAQGLVLSFALMCCCVSAFLRQSTAVFYFVMLAVIFSSYKSHSSDVVS